MIFEFDDETQRRLDAQRAFGYAVIYNGRAVIDAVEGCNSADNVAVILAGLMTFDAMNRRHILKPSIDAAADRLLRLVLAETDAAMAA
jgi:hypothetical protein